MPDAIEIIIGLIILAVVCWFMDAEAFAVVVALGFGIVGIGRLINRKRGKTF